VIPLLVVPTNRKVRFEEISRDVIHSFWVPETLFKRDVLPGELLRNRFEVTFDKEGRYVGRCAELCGTYHAFMQFELVVVAPERFDQFINAKKAGQSTQDAMGTIGFTGDQRFAVTTQPFNTRRDKQSWNQADAATGR
jgi:cytochrome c oxidase subunit 2